MKVEIVIPVINLWTKYTKPCIDSCLEAMVRAKAHGIDAHLVLVDNASTDETPTEGPKLNPELFYYQRNDERWGFQKSVNFGVNFGFEHGAEFALVCNNDITIHPEAIWRLVNRFEKGGIGMATCMDIRGEMQEKGIDPQQIGIINANEKEMVDEAPHPNFSAFMVSKECWETVGEFDELFAPAYFEDNCMHYRMNLAGVAAIVYPPAMFYHFGSRTQNEGKEDGQPFVPGTLFEKNRARYASKWGGNPGSETYDHPFNNLSKTIRSTQQKPDA